MRGSCSILVGEGAILYLLYVLLVAGSCSILLGERSYYVLLVVGKLFYIIDPNHMVLTNIIHK